MAPSVENLETVPTEEELQAQSEKLAGKQRRPREEIPEFEDPQAELAKQPTDLKKPNKQAHEEKVAKIQYEIDTNKRKAESLTKELDAIKKGNEIKKQQGGSEMEAVRTRIREIKSLSIQTKLEKKTISGEIEKVKSQKKLVDDQLKVARSTVGSFTSNEKIDEEVERIKYEMSHNSWSIQEERSFMARLKDLEASRSSVKLLEDLQTQQNTCKDLMSGQQDLWAARREKDERIEELKEKEAEEVAKLDALKEKRDKEISSNKFSELFSERNTIRDDISAKINQIKEMRTAFRAEEDAYYKTERLVRELRRQITRKNREARDAERKAKGELGEVEEEEGDEEEAEAGGEKLIDADLAERIHLCDQLTTYLQSYKPKEVKTGTQSQTVVMKGSGKDNKGLLDHDPLGLNAFMVEEAVSKKKGKKDKKKAKNIAKASKVPEAGEVAPLSLSLDTIQQFGDLALPTPINTDEVDESLEALAKKKAYYEEKGKEGLTLKEVIKQEKESRNEAKRKAQEEEQAAEAAKKAAEEAEMQAQEDALAKIKAAEEAAFMKKQADAEAARQALEAKAQKEAEENAKAKKEAEEKAAAAAKAEEEKAAAEAEALLAAEEAKAQAKAQAEKAREKKRLEEETATSSASPSKDVVDDKFEAWMKQHNLDDEEDEEDMFEATYNGLTVTLQLNEEGAVSCELAVAKPSVAEKKEEVFDLAAARKAAQGTALTEEEKKARGLLYDTSRASAVREDSEEEDDDGGCDFAGGDPFDF